MWRYREVLLINDDGAINNRFTEWEMTNGFNDLEGTSGICELCDHPVSSRACLRGW